MLRLLYPFISEAIYRNLVRSVDSEAPESVHFCDYPIVVEEYIDNDLERDMEVVRKVVNLGQVQETAQKSRIDSLYQRCILN